MSCGTCSTRKKSTGVRFLDYQTKFDLLEQRSGGIDGWPSASPNFTDPSTLLTTLHRAAYDNEVQVLQWCLDTKADIHVKTTMGRTPLHMACEGDAVRSIRFLLEANADANAVSLSLMTPLHFSCRKASYNAVLVLLEADQIIDVNMTDSQHRRPEMMTQNKQISTAISRYRAKLDKKRRKELLEYKLMRLFKAFDKDDSGLINAVEWLNAQAQLARYFKDHCEDAILLAFEEVDEDKSQGVDLEEFKRCHMNMMEAAGTPFHTLMSNLADMENALFEDQRESLQRSAKSSRALMDAS